MNDKETLLLAKKLSDDIQFVFMTHFTSILNEHNLSSKHLTIIEFVLKKGQILMNEVANLVDASPSAASQIISKLEDQDYLKREVNKANRRETFVYLGTKGKELANQIDQKENELIEKYYLQLPREDIEAYCDIIKKLHALVVKEDKA